jgi:hypothetical protein
MILVKTEAGQLAFKERTIRLEPRQRSAFILCDGKRSVEEVQAAGMNITVEDLEQLISLGMLAAAPGSSPVPAAPVATAVAAGLAERPAPNSSTQDRYKLAYPIATRLSSSLGLRGFRLNLAVEGTSSYEELLALAPRIRAAVGAAKAAELDDALDA